MPPPSWTASFSSPVSSSTPTSAAPANASTANVNPERSSDASVNGEQEAPASSSDVTRPPTPLGSKVNQEVIGWAVLSLHTLGWAAMSAIGPLASSVSRRPTPPKASLPQSTPASSSSLAEKQHIDMDVSDKAFSPTNTTRSPVTTVRAARPDKLEPTLPVSLPKASADVVVPPPPSAPKPPVITDRLTPSRALMAVWSSAVSSVSSATSSWLPRSTSPAPPSVPSVPTAPLAASEPTPKKAAVDPPMAVPSPLGLSGLSRKASKSRRPIPAHIMPPSLDRVDVKDTCPASPVPGSFPSWSSPSDSRRASTLSTCSVLSLTPAAIPVSDPAPVAPEAESSVAKPPPRSRSTSIVVVASPPVTSSPSASQPGSRRSSTKSNASLHPTPASSTESTLAESGSTSPGLRRRDNIVVVKPKRPLPATPESTTVSSATQDSTKAKKVAGMIKMFDTLASSPPFAPVIPLAPQSPVSLSHAPLQPTEPCQGDDPERGDKVLVRKQESMARMEEMTNRHRISTPDSPTNDSGVDSMKSDKPPAKGRDSGVSDAAVEELTTVAASVAAMERDSAVITSPRSKPQPPTQPLPAIPDDLVPLPRQSSARSSRGPPPPISAPPSVALPRPLPAASRSSTTPTVPSPTSAAPLQIPELIPRATSVPPRTGGATTGDQSPSSLSTPLPAAAAKPTTLHPKPMRQTKSTLTLYSHRSPSLPSGSLTSWADLQAGNPAMDTPLLSPSLYVDPVAVTAMMQDKQGDADADEPARSPVVYTLAEARAEGLVRSVPGSPALHVRPPPRPVHVLPDAAVIGHRLSMDSLLAGAAEEYGRGPPRKGSDWSSSTPSGSEPTTEGEGEGEEMDPEHKQKMREERRRRRAARREEEGAEEETEEERAKRRAEKKAKKRAKKLAKLQEQVDEARKRKRRTMTIALNGLGSEDGDAGEGDEDEETTSEQAQMVQRAMTGTGPRPQRPNRLDLTGLRGSIGSVSSTDSVTTGTTGSLASPPANGQMRSSRPSSHGYMTSNALQGRRPSSGLMHMFSPASSPTTNTSPSTAAHEHDYRRDSDLSSIGEMYARCSASSSAYGFLVHELGADERSPHLFLEGQLARFPALPRHLFSDWTHLTMLDLSGNGLTELPPSVALLHNLHTLIMRENKLTDFLPEDFGGLEKLVKLDVAVNRLVDLDWTQCVSPRLEYLDVRTNQLTSLSPYLCQLASLKILLVDNNPLTASFAHLATPLRIHPCTNADCPILKHEMGQEEVFSDRMSVLSGRSSRLSIRSAMSETPGLSPTLPSRPGGTSRLSGDSGFAGGDAQSIAGSKTSGSVLNKDLPDLPALPSDIIDMLQDAEAVLSDPVDVSSSLAASSSVHSSASSAPYSAVIYSQSAVNLAAVPAPVRAPTAPVAGSGAGQRNLSADFSAALPASTISAARALAARGRRSNTSPPNSASPGGSTSRSASVAAHMMRTSTAAVTKQFVGMFKKRGKRSSSGMAAGRRSLSSDDDLYASGGRHANGALTDCDGEYMDDEDLCSSVVPGDCVNGHTHLGSIQTIEYVNGLGKLMRYLHDLYDLEPSTSEADEVMRQMRSMVSANRAANEAAGETSISSIRTTASKAASGEEGKRKHIVAEIVATEETYVQELQALFKLYIEPLEQLKYLSPKELHTIFGNVGSILQFHRDALLPQLKSGVSEVGQVFLANAAYLKMYSMFVNGCDKGLAEFDRWASKRKKLRQFVARCRQAPDHRQLNLQSYLLLPVQRIPRYKLLLADLLKHTPETHPDHDALTQALVEIELRAKEINERKREQENMEKLVSVGQRIRMRPNTPKDDQIIQPHRRIIREGELTLVRIVRIGTGPARPSRSSGSTGFGLGAAYGLAMSAYGATAMLSAPSNNSSSSTSPSSQQQQPPLSPTSQAYAAAQLIASSSGAPTQGPVLLDTLIQKEHHFFLFNDMLVICKRDRDGNGHQYDFVFRCNLESRVQPASMTPDGFLRVVDAESILYMTSTESHLRAWMKDINERYSH